MKELLDLANELKNEYPDEDSYIDEIIDNCLSNMEAGESKEKCISRAKTLLLILTEEDK